jgi:hypothetical protein
VGGPIWRAMMGPYGPAWAGGLQCGRTAGPSGRESSREIDRRREEEKINGSATAVTPADLSAFASLAVTRTRRKKQKGRALTARTATRRSVVVVSIRLAGSAAVGSSGGGGEVGMAGDRMSWARLLKWSLSYIDGARPSRAIR